MARVKIRVTQVKGRAGGQLRIAGLESDLRRGPLRQLIDAKGVRIKQRAQRDAPVSSGLHHPKARRPPRPGRLKRSIYARATTYRRLPAVEVGAKVPYLGYVIYPTSPHEIRPRNAKALAFALGPGVFVVTRRVWHPGTAGNNFLDRALEAGGL